MKFKYQTLLALSCLLFLQFVSVMPSQAQEVLRTLGRNPVLEKGQRAAQRSGAGPDTICLPFLDDFSNPRYQLESTTGCGATAQRSNADFYPSNLLWVDELAFVNADYPVDAPTYGVATMDGLDATGNPHNVDADFGSADTLTSKPIFLGGPLDDSVLLSFWIQPGGLGDNPDSQDSLILEFRRADSFWLGVWRAIDTNGAAFTEFEQVVIAIPEAYQYDGFQFRFRNYATRSGNNDHWHIDYVFLDENRNASDELVRDVAFAQAPPSMLSRYREMPWRQFKDFQSSERRAQMEALARNNFNVANNTNFVDSLVETQSGALIGNGPSESAAVPALGDFLYLHNNYEIPGSTPGFNEDSFSASWRLRLNPSDDINPWNDTLIIEQQFRNYYAYDDGTAERAYGLIGTGARFAMRFETNVPDTLYSVFIHWAFVDGSNADKFFSLLVYEQIDTAANGTEEILLYQEDFLTPRYPDSINGFFVYRLEEPIPVNGTFYIGWLQSQSDLLDVGFDRNSLANDRTYFNLGDAWIPSSLQGSVMMRPQLGPDYATYPFVGGIDVFEGRRVSILAYPNPSTGRVWINLEDYPADFYQTWEIFSLSGRRLNAGKINSELLELDISQFDSGLYLLQLSHPSGRSTRAKLIRN
jgi:hypothetical protein